MARMLGLDKNHSFQIGGTYRLDSYDNNFDDYLSSLDIPKIAIALIRASKEMITVTEPTHANPNWTLTMRTGVALAFSRYSSLEIISEVVCPLFSLLSKTLYSHAMFASMEHRVRVEKY